MKLRICRTSIVRCECESCDRGRSYDGPILQTPQSTWHKSHNAAFRKEFCTLLFWMVHSGIWDRCIVGFVFFSMHHQCVVPSFHIFLHHTPGACRCREAGMATDHAWSYHGWVFPSIHNITLRPALKPWNLLIQINNKKSHIIYRCRNLKFVISVHQRHHGIMTCRRFPHNWSSVREIRSPPMDSPQKRCRVLIFFVSLNKLLNNR